MVEGTQVIPRICGGARQVIPKIYRATVQEETRQGGKEEQSEDTEEGMISATSTSPISWHPKELCTPRPANSPGRTCPGGSLQRGERAAP